MCCESRAGEPGGTPGQGVGGRQEHRFHWLLAGEVGVLSGKEAISPPRTGKQPIICTGTSSECVPVNTSQFSFSPTATTRRLRHTHIFLLKSLFISPARMIRRNIKEKSKDVWDR